MTFKDKFPVDFEFEVDRPKLLRYYRTSSLALCCLSILPHTLFLAWAVSQECFTTYYSPGSIFHRHWPICQFTLTIGLGQLVGAIIYFAFFRPASKLAVQNLRLLVEGPFLRVIIGSFIVQDSRIHFRDLHTYTTMQGPLQRWFGLKTLSFKAGSRSGPSGIKIDGLVDPDEVRDRLCLIDASRENAD